MTTTIHDKIRTARTAKGWSMEQLAAAVSREEGLGKPLAWQTVQQWEKSTAPKRRRLELVAKLLDIPLVELVMVDPADHQGFTPISPLQFARVWVVGRGSGGLMPEKIWTDGDYPVGATAEYAEVASHDARAFLVEVIGPSMVPRYNPGEFALIEPGTEPEIEDDVLVRLKDGQTLLKRLLSRRGGYRLGSYNDAETHFYPGDEVAWIYYVAHPVPRRKIKSRL